MEPNQRAELNRRLLAAAVRGDAAQYLALRKQGVSNQLEDVPLFHADINAADERGWTLLHWAAMMGEAQHVHALIRKGANANARNSNGSTPLHVALWGSHTQTALALIKLGTDMNARDASGWTPLHLAAGAGETLVALTLIENGAEPNPLDEGGASPLYWAAKNGHVKTVEKIQQVISLAHARRVQAITRMANGHRKLRP